MTHSLFLVLFLYIIRCPHSLQRIGSLDLISFFAPQSGNDVTGKGWKIDSCMMPYRHRYTPYPVVVQASPHLLLEHCRGSVAAAVGSCL